MLRAKFDWDIYIQPIPTTMKAVYRSLGRKYSTGKAGAVEKKNGFAGPISKEISKSPHTKSKSKKGRGFRTWPPPYTDLATPAKQKKRRKQNELPTP